MYRKVKSGKRKHVKLQRKLAILLTCLIVMAGTCVGTAVAFLAATTSAVENTFSAGTITGIIEEDFTDPVKTIKKDVKITNESKAAVYVRAQIIINWQNAEGNVVPSASVPTDEYSYVLNLGPGGWIQGADGYYYYTSSVKSGTSTENLIDTCTVTVNAEKQEYWLQVEILSEVIQANPATAVEEAWDVTVNSDGTISK